jgi:uncharacterized Tic20 family protein
MADDLDDLDGIERAGEKRKRGTVSDPDEVVDLESLVSDYESKYSRLRADESDDDEPYVKPKRGIPEPPRPPQPPWTRKGWKPSSEFGHEIGQQITAFFQRPYEPGYRQEEAESTDKERNTAALAHASALLTILLGMFSGGMLVPFLIFIPLGIYLSNRSRSEFVAQNAMQAFVAQLMGTFGWLAVVIISALIGVVLTVLLAITIVGVLAIPFLWIAIVLFWIATLAMPLGSLAFGIVGALAALQGKVYRYPYVSKLFDRQMRRRAY